MVNQALKDKILELLGQGPLGVTELAAKLICANQKVMEAVDELDDQGLLESQIEGSAVVYALVSQSDAKRPVVEGALPKQNKTAMDDTGSKKATIKQMIVEVLQDIPSKTITRAQLIAALNTVQVCDLDNVLAIMKSENTLHSVARGVVRLGAMPVQQAAASMEQIVAQAIPEAVVTSKPTACQSSTTNEQGVKFWVFDDGSLVLRLGSGGDLTLTPDEAQRAHKLLNLFYRGAQA